MDQYYYFILVDSNFILFKAMVLGVGHRQSNTLAPDQEPRFPACLPLPDVRLA